MGSNISEFLRRFGSLIGLLLLCFILSVTTNQHLVMMLLILVLIVIGCVLEGFAAILIFAPVFAPVATSVSSSELKSRIVTTGEPTMEAGGVLRYEAIIRAISPAPSMPLRVTDTSPSL